jgi:hypothetical protein
MCCPNVIGYHNADVDTMVTQIVAYFLLFSSRASAVIDYRELDHDLLHERIVEFFNADPEHHHIIPEKLSASFPSTLYSA